MLCHALRDDKIIAQNTTISIIPLGLLYKQLHTEKPGKTVKGQNGGYAPLRDFPNFAGRQQEAQTDQPLRLHRL